MKIFEEEVTKGILKKNNIRLQKRLGQNFLIHEPTVNKIVEAAQAGPEDLIVEIGPGIGSLTQQLIETGAQVISVELDQKLIPVLNKNLGNHENFQIVQGDALKIDQAAEMILFVDGDMTGDLSNNLQQLIDTAKKQNLDLALTNCYPTKGIYSSLAQRVMCYRFRLNNTLGYAADLDVASPSHGPHVLSLNFLEKVPFDYLAKPPLLLALAKINNLQVGIGTVIAHSLLGSKQKGSAHNILIADTIVGDCLEAITLYQGKPRNRSYRDKFYSGYDAQRRFDLLHQYLNRE